MKAKVINIIDLKSGKEQFGISVEKNGRQQFVSENGKYIVFDNHSDAEKKVQEINRIISKSTD